jgi:ubiquinone/menaquinone biosynthesis C-methylase UbiE
MSQSDIEAAARLWGDPDRRGYYESSHVLWAQLPAVQRRINEKISGDPDVDWVDHLKATHLAGRAPVPHCLSLCCWYGETERMLSRRGVFRQCTAYDVSEGALAQAREAAAKEGIQNVTYMRQDVNSMVLPEGEFDLIVAHGGLHHIVALEHVLDEINRGLKADGLLVALEYVGPSRFRFPKRQQEVANLALRLLPERFRRSISWQRLGRVGPGAKRSRGAWLKLLWLKVRNGTLAEALVRRAHYWWLRRTGKPLIKRAVPRIVGSEMAIDDPTEAVRSAEITPLLRQKLQVVEYKPYGGAVLLHLLDDIAGNFETDEPGARELLDMLFAIEDALMAAGEIDSDFAYVVAGKRGAARG